MIHNLEQYNDSQDVPNNEMRGIYGESPAEGRYAAFKVLGDSMDDGTIEGFRKGSILKCRELQKGHWQTSLNFKDFPYWVIYTKHARLPLVKQIIEHNSQDGYILCHSLNNDLRYRNFQLELNDIQAMFYVTSEVIIRAKDFIYYIR